MSFHSSESTIIRSTPRGRRMARWSIQTNALFRSMERRLQFREPVPVLTATRFTRRLSSISNNTEALAARSNHSTLQTPGLWATVLMIRGQGAGIRALQSLPSAGIAESLVGRLLLHLLLALRPIRLHALGARANSVLGSRDRESGSDPDHRLQIPRSE